jgi:hypothetical protein
MSDADKPPETIHLTAEDFKGPAALDVSAKTMRDLIEGLRALPNVSDLAVIKAIGEFDRIASYYENSYAKRDEIMRRSTVIAERWVKEGKLPQEIFDLMKRVGGVPPSVLQAVIDEAIGPTPAGATCQCPRCTSLREQAAAQGGTATLQ